MRIARYALAVAALGWILAGSAWAAETVIDNFEGYASDAELQAAWVAVTANASTALTGTAYDGVQALKINSHNGQDPWWTNVVFSLPAPMDLTDFSRLTLRFREIAGNAGENLIVQLKDEYGNWFDGPLVANATQITTYTEYEIGIGSWAERTNFQTIEIHMPAVSYGAFEFYIDRIAADTFPPLVDGFEGYASDAELQPVCAPGTANCSTGIGTPGLGSSQCMTITYHNGQDPWWTNAIYTFGSPQDWSSFLTLGLWFKGQAGNSGEALEVQLKEEYGGYVNGPWVGGATQILDWTYYEIDISGWGARTAVTSIEFHLPAQDYGAGVLCIDQIMVSEFPATATDTESWTGIKEMFR